MCKKIKLRRNNEKPYNYERKEFCDDYLIFYKDKFEICENIYNLAKYMTKNNLRSKPLEYYPDEIICRKCDDSFSAVDLINLANCFDLF